MLMIETPGKTGRFKARIVAVISFDDCFLYESPKAFYLDKTKHCVDQRSDWKWTDLKPKWGWRISKVVCFKSPKPAPRRKGIVYTKNIRL
jgi:hypothetical protein